MRGSDVAVYGGLLALCLGFSAAAGWGANKWQRSVAAKEIFNEVSPHIQPGESLSARIIAAGKTNYINMTNGFDVEALKESLSTRMNEVSFRLSNGRYLKKQYSAFKTRFEPSAPVFDPNWQ